MPARWVRIQVAAHETQLLHAARQLAYRSGRIGAGRLRQLAYAHEITRKQGAHAMDEVVANPRPREADRSVPDVVAHARGAR